MNFDISLQQLQDPYELWEQARNENPVFYSNEFKCWLVTRYADVEAVLREPDTFSSARSFDPSRPLPARVQEVLDGRWAATLLVNVDQPAHTPIRRAINRALTHKRVENSAGIIRRVAVEMLDELYPKGQIDLMSEFARLFPARVVADILGIPAAEVPNIIHWGEDFEEILAATAPEEHLLKAAHGLVEYQQYFVDAIEARLREPQDDLLTAIAQQFVGNPELDLTVEQVADLPLAVFTAGHNTTTLAIGNTVFHYLKYPERFQPSFGEDGKPNFYDAVDEMLRFESPFPFLRRTVMRDSVVGGVEIPAGDTVMVSLSSANRDENMFEGAGMLDVCRENARRHFAFGAGIHFCPGKSLARREVSTAVELILERLPNLRMGEYERVQRFVNRGFSRLDLQWDVK
jgi:cytochrome P450